MSRRPHLTATSSRPQPPPPSPFPVVAAFLTSSPSAVASVSFPPSQALASQNPWNDVPGAAQGMSSASMAEGEASEFTEVVVVRHVETSWNASRIIQVVFDPALQERHIGDLQGLKFEDAATERPEAYKAFMSHKRNQQIPISIPIFVLLRKC